MEGLHAANVHGDVKDEILAATQIPGFVTLTLETIEP